MAVDVNSTPAKAEGPFAGSTRPSYIASSWDRSSRARLDPQSAVGVVSIEQIERDSRLLRAARPLLDSLAEDLSQIRCTVILADRNSRIVYLRATERGIGGALEKLGGVQGRRFTEEFTGTNAIALPFETRSPVAVRGEEHYLESFRSLSCFGYPILHPVHGRIQGVLNITCRYEDDNQLLLPLLAAATAQRIRDRIFDELGASEQAAARAFRLATAQSSLPTFVLHEEYFFANRSGLDQLDQSDIARLRAMAVPGKGLESDVVALSSGRQYTARAEPVSGTNAVLVRLDRNPSRQSSECAANSEGSRTASRVLICGETGTGRTAKALDIASATGQRIQLLDPLKVPAENWHERLGGALREADSVIVVDDLERLSQENARFLARELASNESPIVIVCGDPNNLVGEHRLVATSCDDRIVQRALRDQPEQIPALFRSQLAETGSRARATASVLQALSSYEWPGNFRELADVVRKLEGRVSFGDITMPDLPQHIQTAARGRKLSPLEHAERATIQRVLKEKGGVKSAAASALGISRTTLYTRIRRLGIS